MNDDLPVVVVLVKDPLDAATKVAAGLLRDDNVESTIMPRQDGGYDVVTRSEGIYRILKQTEEN